MSHEKAADRHRGRVRPGRAGRGSGRAETLDSCLAQHHVCVSDSGRKAISTAQQDQLEQQIGDQPIYLVVATSGSAGYASAMRQLISDLGGHDEFTAGFPTSAGCIRRLQPGDDAHRPRRRPGDPGGRQHQGDGDIFAALTDFVGDVKQQAGSSGDGGTDSGPSVGLIVVLVRVVGLAVAGIGALFVVRGRRRRRQQEELRRPRWPPRTT